MFYAISAFAVNSKEDKLRYITPFQYFKTDYIIAENNFELKFLILGFSVIIISLIASYVIYLKRISFGGLQLDENLKKGEYRELTKQEIELLL